MGVPVHTHVKSQSHSMEVWAGPFAPDVSQNHHVWPGYAHEHSCNVLGQPHGTWAHLFICVHMCAKSQHHSVAVWAHVNACAISQHCLRVMGVGTHVHMQATS